MEKRLTNYFRKEINIWAVPSNNVKRTVTYESKKLVTKFRLKDKTKFHRQNNIVYYSKYSYETCTEDYPVSDTDKWIEERTIDQNIRDRRLHILS